MLAMVVASRNQKKAQEIRQLIGDLAITLLSPADFPDLPEVIEDGQTFSANASKKARQTALFTGHWAIADDSGLEVDALSGQPGIYSARFAGEGASDAENNAKLLRMLSAVPPGQRGAQFRCVIAIASPQGEVVTCEGVCRGEIAQEPRGKQGFGYDPLFVVPQYAKTFAELGDEVKNQISHRGRALRQARVILKSLVEGENGSKKLLTSD